MRQPSVTDFDVPVADVGDFRFARRTVGDVMKIRAIYHAMVGDTDDETLSYYAGAVAALTVLAVSAPPGFENPARIDLIETPDALDKVLAVYNALRQKEDSFRRGPTLPGAADGAGNGGDAAVPVPQEVQPPAE